jgi:MOSC domain-containing protein YiiM
MALSKSELETAFRTMPSPPKDEGTVVLVVVRPEAGEIFNPERITPERITLTPEEGVPGDRWGKRPHKDNLDQITVMRADVGQIIGEGQPLTTFGDQLIVDMDISTANLPPGTRLRVGDALCEVSPKPHTGCGKYSARFGEDARAVVNAPEFADQHLRGMYIFVVEPGEVGPGDRIQVLSRPQSAQQTLSV